TVIPGSSRGSTWMAGTSPGHDDFGSFDLLEFRSRSATIIARTMENNWVTDWTEGYVAEINYTFGYYSELNPIRTSVLFLNVGLAPPAVATACELGFGQDLSVNIHAAASDVRWH